MQPTLTLAISHFRYRRKFVNLMKSGYRNMIAYVTWIGNNQERLVDIF